jgi:lipid-binding SYLF domain-containing protein
MKTSMMRMFNLFILLSLSALPIVSSAQEDDDESKLIADANEAKTEFIKADNLMSSLFDNSYGYVIFPNVGKGAIGVGGAAGNGIVYEGGKMIGKAKMKQVSVGFQFGGQAYREVIFFEDKTALDKFKEGKFEFAAQASAVAATKGASANVKYRDGVMVFTQEKKGLMYEASVGGQKFSYSALKS